MEDTLVVVTAAVIVRGGRLLIAQRGAGDPNAFRWELPGGKVADGESLAACMERELAEELGIVARAGEVLCATRHRAGGRIIELSAVHVLGFEGEPTAIEHAGLAWALPGEWRRYDFLEPDVALLECLRTRWEDLVRDAGRGR